MFLAVWGGGLGTFGGHSHLLFCEPNKRVLGNFPGGPVVKNPSCNAGDMDLIPGQGNNIPHAWDQLSPVTQMKDPATKIPSVATEIQDSQINKLRERATECFGPCNCLPPQRGLLCLYVRHKWTLWQKPSYSHPFTYFCLCWVFTAFPSAFSSCREWGLRSSPRAWASLGAEHGTWSSVAMACAPSRCSSRAPENKHSSFGSWAELLCSMWNLPRPGIKPMSFALAGRFLTTGPPESPQL